MDFFSVDGVSLDDSLNGAGSHQRIIRMQRISMHCTAPYPRVEGRGRQRPSLRRLQDRLSEQNDHFDGGDDEDDGETMQMAETDASERPPARPPALPRSIQRLMNPPVTADDEQFQVNNDNLRFRFRPVPHPDRQRQIDAARASDLVKECFLCNYKSSTLGDSASLIDGEEITKLLNYIADKKDILPRKKFAEDVHKWFNLYIRRPADSRRQLTQEPIPDWTVESIIHHLSGHDDNVQDSLIDELIDTMATQVRFIKDHGLFMVPVTHPPDAPVAVEDLRINMHMAKTINDAIKQIRDMYLLKAKFASEGGVGSKSAKGSGTTTAARVDTTYFDRQLEKKLY